mgnify:CR=1 FL=1
MKDWTVLDSQIVMYALSEGNKDQDSHRKAISIIKKHGDHLVICPLIAFELLQNVQLNSDEVEQRTAFCSSQISPAYDLLSAQFAAEIRRRIRQERDRGNAFAGERGEGLPEFTMDVQILGWALRWNVQRVISHDKRCILKVAPFIQEIPLVQKYRPRTQILSFHDPSLQDQQLTLDFDSDQT